MRSKLITATTMIAISTSIASALTFPKQVRHVLVISVDGMHALDLALWVKSNPNSSLGQLSAAGVQFTNAYSTKPVDSIPGTVGIFTGASPSTGGMYYDDAWHRGWFAPANTTCAGAPGTIVDLKQGIDVNPNLLDSGGIDPAKLPRQLVNNVCTPVYPHNMLRVNTVFEVVKGFRGRTAYSEKRPAYDFLHGPSGVGVDDLYVPEINANNTLASLPATEAFDELRVQSILREIDGKNSAGVTTVGVPIILGMNFQSINSAKKVSPNSGYADSQSTPDSFLANALQYVDVSVGKFVSQLALRGLTDSTAIIITAKHAESPLDPTHRNIQLTSSIPAALSAAGFPASTFKITLKSAALLWVFNQANVPAMVAALSVPSVQASLNVSQILSGESLKLLFPDPLTDPAVPDIIIIPNNGTNYEPSLASTTFAEHGGFNENETHVPLLVVHNTIKPGKHRQPVTTTQIAPTILNLLNIDPKLLQAVKTEGTDVLPGIPTNGPIYFPFFLLP